MSRGREQSKRECEVCGKYTYTVLYDEDNKPHWFCDDCIDSDAAIEAMKKE